MRKTGVVLAIFLFLLIFNILSLAAEPVGEVEALKARVAHLEAQNREILALLREIQGAEKEPSTASPPPPTATAEAPIQHTVKVGKSRLSFYGFVRLDAIFDDSRPSAIQTPTFIPSETPATANEDSFNLHPRLTRVGMNYKGPKIGGDGPGISGKIEFDFQNGGRESRQAVRMRHGYMNLDWEKSSLLIGQTWDLISPLYPTVNSDTLMWNAGNLGDRRPQIRYAKIHETAGGELSFQGGIGLTGAINSQDLDSDGVRDGDDAVLPNLQTRLGYRSKTWSIGFSGHYGQEEVRTPIAGEDRFDSYSANLDLRAALSPRLTLKGELWTGSNLSDFRGGAGQSINRISGREISSSGGWVELGVRVSDRYSIYGGVTLDDPDDDDLSPGNIRKNGSAYLVNRWSFGREFLVGLDYLRWETEFVDLPDGTDNRLNLYFIYTF